MTPDACAIDEPAKLGGAPVSACAASETGALARWRLTLASSWSESPAQAVWRLFLAHVVAALSLAPVAALAVAASTASSRTGTAAAIAGGVYFGLTALASLAGLEALRPYLIVLRLDAWQAFMAMDIAWGRFIADGIVLAVTFAFLAGASILMIGDKELSPHR